MGDILYFKANMDLFNPPFKKAAHFIGIGGIGMSALAQWFLAKNWAVSGSDIEESAITLGLAKSGVKIKIGHKKGNISRKTNLLVYNQAVELDNPELLQARRFKIPVFSEPALIGILSKDYKTIAVTGAHGKSTATAMTGLLLKDVGLDPTIIVGTKLKELKGGNFRMGQSRYLVLEADEWHKKLLHYSPAFSVVTNIDKEHLDSYKNLSDIKKTFLKFLSRTKSNGVLILNGDNKNLFSLKSKITKIAKEKNLSIFWYSIKSSIAQKIKKILKVPGAHNLSNALAAYTIGKIFKISESGILKSLSKYRGSWRRMEFRGRFKVQGSRFKVPVYDDYAHHPTEIKATLKAFREKFPGRKLICVFQPHQAKRLAYLFHEFQSAFDEADITLILPIYEVAGRDKINPRFTSKKLVKAIQKKNPKQLIFYLENPKNLKNALKILLNSKFRIPSSPVLVMMGAGDIVNYTDSLLS